MTVRPRLLDLFSGAGGCARGYQRAGFHVTGVDVQPQPRYAGDDFVQADALVFLAAHGRDFDATHASPPCQAYSQVNRRAHLAGKVYPDLIGAVRVALIATARPWVIENVEAAPLRGAVRLCGTSFGLPIRRHRLFEAPFVLLAPACEHGRFREKKYPTCFQPPGGPRRRSSVVQVYGHTHGVALWPEALGIDWMNRQEMTQAIPPVFCEWVGRQLRRVLPAYPEGA